MRRCSSAEELKIAGTPPALACMLAHPAATWGAPFLPQTPRLTVSAPAAVALFRVQVIKVDVTKKVGHAADIHNAAGVGGVGGEQRQQHVGQQEVAEVVDLRLEGLLTVNSVEVERGLRSAVVVAFLVQPCCAGAVPSHLLDQTQACCLCFANLQAAPHPKLQLKPILGLQARRRHHTCGTQQWALESATSQSFSQQTPCHNVLLLARLLCALQTDAMRLHQMQARFPLCWHLRC